MKVKTDIKQLKELQKKLQQFEAVKFDEVAEKCTNEIAARLIRKTVKRTPVKSGHLKGNWKANPAMKRRGQWRTAVYNPVKYAPYVEYGHRTRGGDWRNGKFMLTKSSEEINKDAQKIIEKEVNKELMKVFK